MFCPYCNSEINDGLKFCPKCGSPVASASYQQPVQQYQDPYQQPYQQQYQQPPVFNQAPVQPMQFYSEQPQADNRVPGKGLGIASMVLGIIAFVFSCYLYLSLPLGLTSLILGVVGRIKAKSADKKNGCATAGIICSILALAWVILFALGIGSMLGLSFMESM